jgi:hypothetical protein
MRLKLIFSAFCMVVCFAFTGYQYAHAQDGGPGVMSPHATPAPIPTVAPLTPKVDAPTEGQGAPKAPASSMPGTWTALGLMGALVAFLKFVQGKEKGLAALPKMGWLAHPVVDDAIAYALAICTWWLSVPPGGSLASKVLTFAGFAFAGFMATFFHTKTQPASA